ncbi:MAG: hypothetical protein AAGF31_12495 [Planctomycetota bacterium]
MSAGAILAGAMLVGCAKEQPSGQPGNIAAELATDTAETVEQAEGITASEVLAKLTEAYQQADTYFDNAEYHERFVQRGDGVPREPQPHKVAVVFERPRRLRMDRSVPGSGDQALSVLLVCDGERLRVKSSDQPKEMLDIAAPAEISRDTLQSVSQLAPVLLPVPLEMLYPQLDLLIGTPTQTASLASGTDTTLLPSKSLTTSSLDGVDCYRLRIDQPSGAFVAWIDKQSSILHRLEMPIDEVRRQLDPDNDLMRLDLWIDFHNASFDSPIGFKTFQVEPGDGVQLVESLAEETNSGDESIEKTPAAAADE